MDAEPKPDPGPPDPDADFVRLSRSEIEQLRRAGRARWGIPDPVRTEAIIQLAKIVAGRASPRTKISAVRALAALDKIDQGDERAADEGSKPEDDGPTLREYLRDDQEPTSS